MLRPESTPGRPLRGLAGLLGIPSPRGSEEVLVSGITHDSRAVHRGDLFAALPGSRAHGAGYAYLAATAGAAAVLTDPSGRDGATRAGLPVLTVLDPRARLGEVAAWIYGDPAAHLRLVGVTGTNGKTTTAYLLEAGMRAAGHTTGLIGTIETRIGDDAVPSVRTTPEATDLQALFAVARERGVTAAAMEVSSHALALGRVDGTAYEVGLFTNLSQDHLDFHGSLEDYFQVKASLFTPQRCRRAVVNVDDPYGARLRARLGGVGVVPVTTVSPGGGSAADWRADGVTLRPSGSTFHAVGPGGVSVEVSTHLAGQFNVANALCAVVALVEAGIPLDRAAQGVGRVAGIPGRMERVDGGQPFLAVVDYAHTPDAVTTLLMTLRELTRGELLVVLGCGGDRDRAKRPFMGAAAARLADVAVFTTDNPRSEDPFAILVAMQEGATSVTEVERAELLVVPDRAAAIATAVGWAQPQDTVVIAGKGHEQGQEVAGAVRPFDDREQLRGAIELRYAGQRRGRVVPGRGGTTGTAGTGAARAGTGGPGGTAP